VSRQNGKAFRTNGHARPDTGIPVSDAGPSPLEVMLTAMRAAHARGDLAAAAAFARDAAPYCHPRLTSAALGGTAGAGAGHRAP
jgi:hypothetical protein